MDHILLERNPLTGEEEWMHYDESTDTTYVEQRYDAQANIDRAHVLANQSFGFSRFSELRPLAEIPNTLVYQWLKEGFNLMTATREQLERKMADYPKLRTAPKRTHHAIIISGSR